jgi:hypothetical protein
MTNKNSTEDVKAFLLFTSCYSYEREEIMHLYRYSQLLSLVLLSILIILRYVVLSSSGFDDYKCKLF